MTIQQAVEFRRDLHRLAELSGREYQTAQYIKDHLQQQGFAVKDNVGGTGLVCDIDSGVEGPTVMIRADMDALPYPAEDGSDTMVAVHACGHDAHSAMLLAAASDIRAVLKRGKVRLAFQPGEESLEGAQAMIKDGVLDGVDTVLGLHIRPIQDIPFGSFCAQVNHVACATVEIKIVGKQAHAARPHLGINPIEAAGQLIGTIGLIKQDPNKSWSVKPTQIHSEAGATNSIPNYVTVTFDVRAQDNEILNGILKQLRGAAAAAQAAFGVKADAQVTEYCPGPDYDPALVKTIEETIVDEFGENALAPSCGGGGEDFHFYKIAKPQVKTAYFGVGSGATPGLHARNMSFDDSVLPSGSRLLVAIVKKLLG